ncbi:MULTISPECIES: hypothetical protein [unclassified Mycobacterium]|uniref:hypothetical protein n=1 Tax=unclassified Mycobacterium TaxID=2642494 RepID=UPI0007FFA976|nr:MULTISPECIES: hypothetical protein [unclassified Mycobacterium]OBH03601.1 hypothetical protein A5696_00455 [Mycobacterium sp. E2699]OBI54879.1 hypothetical protein A5705_24190 [Mycobacterium sp. E787]
MSERPVDGQSRPAERAAQVEQRVKELRNRRAELAAGQRPSPESVSLARHRAEESLQAAAAAHHAAAQRHEELARVHEQTANTYQRAAMDGLGSSAQLQRAADEHWQAAHDSHLDAVADEAQAENPKKSSSD